MLLASRNYLYGKVAVFSLLIVISGCGKSISSTEISIPNPDPMVEEALGEEEINLNEEIINSEEELGAVDPKPKTPRPFEMLFSEKNIKPWYLNDLSRGQQRVKGDLPNGISRVGNRLPRTKSSGYEIVYCAGTGCPVKVAFVYTPEHLATVKIAMDKAREDKGCTKDSAVCELVALSQGVASMEKIIYEESLKTMSFSEMISRYVEDDFRAPERNMQLDSSDIDQATNGASYLYILGKEELMYHHRVIYTGSTIEGFARKYYTRIQNIDSEQKYRFDLFHKGKFGILPVIKKLQ